MMQNTLQEKISFSGFGVHSAIFSKIEITPAPADAGIAFVHGDFLTEPIKLGCEIPLEAMHATVLKQKSWVLSTVEHLIAALRMTGIDNATIFIKGGSEIPILDGSAAPFFNRICRVGLVNQGVQKKYLMPRAEISLVDDQGNRAITLKPLHDEASYGDLYCDYQASFNHFVLGYKRVLYKVDQQLF
ncbi:hypothetical protein FJ364_02540, partial [Candidatus Dependentiae bacterium]|nr:hypothetical protein [Candidatus Dependentiae bacterium]